MSSEREFLLLDLLYGERDDESLSESPDDPAHSDSASGADAVLESGADETADAEASAADDLQTELEALSSLRALFRELPEEEPSPAITTKLLHAAALHAPKPTRASADDETEKRGFFAWLAGLFRPIATHPGLAAAASLALIVVVTGTVYMSGKDQFADPQVSSSSSSPTPVAPIKAEDSKAEFEARVPEAPNARDEGQSAPGELAGNGDGQFAQPKANIDGKLAEQPAKDLDRAKGAERRRSVNKKKARTARAYEGKALNKALDKPLGKPLDNPDDLLGDRASSTRLEAEAAEESQWAAPPPPIPPNAKQTPAIAVGEADEDMDPTLAVQAEAPEPAPASGSAASISRGADAPAKRPAKSSKKKRKAPSSSKKSTRADSPSDSDANRRARIRSLHNEARAAAADNNCSTVREAGRLIAKIDSSYYQNSFRRDNKLATCLADKSR